MAKDWPVLIDDEEKGYEIEIMASSLETIFASYLERFPNPLIKEFSEAIQQSLYAILQGKHVEWYEFGFGISNENGTSFVSFSIEDTEAEIVSGGSVYDPQIDSDTLPSTRYALGDGDVYLLENLLDEAAVLVDEGAKLHVDMPEEYFPDEDE